MNISERKELINSRLREIEEERILLEKELQELSTAETRPDIIVIPASSAIPDTPEEKISLFLELFRCREDVYPHRWENSKTGKSGYSPVCANEWKRGICNKIQTKCSDCLSRASLPLDAEAVRSHLEGKEVIGTYAIREDDTTIFLAADFDGTDWHDDVMRYKKAANEFGIDTAVEISRSGEGAHAWIFFTEPVTAFLARRLGTVIMTRALSLSGSFSLASYDRFFPNQDYIPDGGFGNLIALPLQYISRKDGRTLFVNDEFIPFHNQWEYLAGVKRLSRVMAESILDNIISSKDQFELSNSDENDINYAEKDIDLLADEINENIYNGTAEIQISSMLSIDAQNLPSGLLSALRRITTFANPKFFELQRMRFSTWNTPRYICCAEYDGRIVKLPRGTLDVCSELLEQAGASVIIKDIRPRHNMLNITFKGDLREDQKKAVDEIIKNEFGILVSPPGTGKTVIGCSLIARRGVSTLILVHRKQLIDQWKERLVEFLDIDKKSIGVIGGGSSKSKGTIDIAMLQTISRKNDVNELLAGYEQIIIDECHHIPAVSFEAALKDIPARYVVGLTATPYRKDGLQAILFMQCGPVRYMIEETNDLDLKKRVIVRESSFNLPEHSRTLPIYEIWEHLVNDDDRLELVVSDIVSAIKTGRIPLVLSDRKDHLYRLKEKLDAEHDIQGVKGFMLEGVLGKKARAAMIMDINDLIKNGDKTYIISTGSLIGEGFDMPQLDTLFLTMPLSFKGRIIQYAGRLHRSFTGKKEVIIYDYCDSNIGLTASMFKKRVSVYKNIGYQIDLTGNQKIDKWINHN